MAREDFPRRDGVAGDELLGEVDGELAGHVDGGRLAHAVRDVAGAAHHAVLGAAVVGMLGTDAMDDKFVLCAPKDSTYNAETT